MQNTTFNDIYKKDKATNSYIIDIKIKNYDDLFNGFDFSPYQRKDINSNIKEFIEECSTDIPAKYKIKLNFNILKNNMDKEQEEKVKNGYKNYFSLVLNSIERKYKSTSKSNLFYVLIAFFLLSISTTLVFLFHISPLINMLVEIISIGCWVFLWQAITTFFFDNKVTKKEYKFYKRIYDASILFNYY